MYTACIYVLYLCHTISGIVYPFLYHSLHNISISFPIIITLHHGHVVCLLNSRRTYTYTIVCACTHKPTRTHTLTHIYMYILYILNPQKHFWSRSSASLKEKKRDKNMIFTPLSRVIQNWYFLSVLIFFYRDW
jgi:hypothetical protein